MNKLTIIGNLTRDPELRTTQSGISVCTFTVAVNRRQKDANGQNAADYFRVTAWRELGENCAKFLQKGRKVAVIGPVSVNTYQGNDGRTYANLEVQAQDVEFLTSLAEAQRMAQEGQPTAAQNAAPAPAADPQTGYEQVSVDDELPF